MLFHRRAALLCALALPFSSGLAGVVTDHGMLQASGNQILDKNGVPFQVAGNSLYWSIWGGQKFFNQGVIDQITNNWKSTIVRVPTSVDENSKTDKGFIADSAGTIKTVSAAIDAAIQDDIYVVVDWHCDTAANKEEAKATSFFTYMAKTYGSKPNVIFEIWNEPNGVKWDTIRSYANVILPVIRQYSNNLVVVGTPTWSQDVDTAAKRPISDPNVAYTLHFYACTHGHSLLNRANTALKNGIPLFVTEFGLSPSDGGQHPSASNKNVNDYKICTDSATFWLDWADSAGVSWANWSLSDKDESSAALLPSDSTKGDSTKVWAGTWVDADISPSGLWIRSRLQARAAAASSLVGGIRTSASRPQIVSSASGLAIRLPTSTTQAELFDISGHLLVRSSSAWLGLSQPVSGVAWLRWTDGSGLHAASIAIPR